MAFRSINFVENGLPKKCWLYDQNFTEGKKLFSVIPTEFQLTWKGAHQIQPQFRKLKCITGNIISRKTNYDFVSDAQVLHALKYIILSSYTSNLLHTGYYHSISHPVVHCISNLCVLTSFFHEQMPMNCLNFDFCYIMYVWENNWYVWTPCLQYLS